VSGPLADVRVPELGSFLPAIDLDHPEAPPLVRRVPTSVNVLIANLRPGALEARGLGRDELSGNSPSLAYGAIWEYRPRGAER
jgi:crotonobetainyl-CoA:carnitine CoA-transferase CaiB-like acyl-CoA transferase